MTLAELLEQWAAAEPDRCRREPHSLAGTMRIQRGITGQMKIVPRAREHQPWELDSLLGAVKEAAEARGFIWKLEALDRYEAEGGGYGVGNTYKATLSYTPAGMITRTEIGPPVVAFLAAYLEAVEARS